MYGLGTDTARLAKLGIRLMNTINPGPIVATFQTLSLNLRTCNSHAYSTHTQVESSEGGRLENWPAVLGFEAMTCLAVPSREMAGAQAPFIAQCADDGGMGH